MLCTLPSTSAANSRPSSVDQTAAFADLCNQFAHSPTCCAQARHQLGNRNRLSYPSTVPYRPAQSGNYFVLPWSCVPRGAQRDSRQVLLANSPTMFMKSQDRCHYFFALASPSLHQPGALSQDSFFPTLPSNSGVVFPLLYFPLRICIASLGYVHYPRRGKTSITTPPPHFRNLL